MGDHALVVGKRITGDSSIEGFGWITVFRKRTKVEDVVLVLMSCIKKTLHVLARVSIESLDANCREAHYNYLRSTYEPPINIEAHEGSTLSVK